jgi:hypothetical protein
VIASALFATRNLRSPQATTSSDFLAPISSRVRIDSNRVHGLRRALSRRTHKAWIDLPQFAAWRKTAAVARTQSDDARAAQSPSAALITAS